MFPEVGAEVTRGCGNSHRFPMNIIFPDFVEIIRQYNMPADTGSSKSLAGHSSADRNGTALAVL